MNPLDPRAMDRRAFMLLRRQKLPQASIVSRPTANSLRYLADHGLITGSRKLSVIVPKTQRQKLGKIFVNDPTPHHGV